MNRSQNIHLKRNQSRNLNLKRNQNRNQNKNPNRNSGHQPRPETMNKRRARYRKHLLCDENITAAKGLQNRCFIAGIEVNA